jgi:hypothetical protein
MARMRLTTTRRGGRFWVTAQRDGSRPVALIARRAAEIATGSIIRLSSISWSNSTLSAIKISGEKTCEKGGSLLVLLIIETFFRFDS